MKDRLAVCGRYEFTGYNAVGVVVDRRVYHNVVTQHFWDKVFAFLDYDDATPSADAMQVTYFVTGDGTSIADRTDTALDNERHRQSVTAIVRKTSVIEIETTIAPADSNFTITEVGLFMGGNVSTPDSGDLLSRANTDIDKTAATQYIVKYKLSMEAA